jgi:hypothetical protein
MALHTAAVMFGDQPCASGALTKVRINTLTQGTAFTLTHGGPAAVPDRVTFEIFTAPSDGSTVSLVRTTTSDTTTVAGLTFLCAADGSTDGVLTGAVLDVYFHWTGVKAGGIS